MINQNLKRIFSRVVILLILLLSCARCPAQDSYDQLVRTAGSLLKQGKLDEAKQTVQQAIQQNATGYMAYAVAAKIASQQGAAADAKNFIQKALQLAPDEDSKARLQQLAAILAPADAPAPVATPAVVLAVAPTNFPDGERVKLNALNLLFAKAGDKAATPEESAQVCGEILTRSGYFLKAHPEQTNVWIMRGVAAVVLDKGLEGWGVGQHLKALGMLHSQDPDVSHLMAELELKGWLKQQAPKFLQTGFPQMDQPYQNSLGMKFVPVPGTQVLFGIWDVRVQDFEAFVNATGYDAIGGMVSLWKGHWVKTKNTWQNPSFTQEPMYPVVGVSWNDAKAFCEWLTSRERAAGNIRESQSYRLPQEMEWNQAVGNTKYPWGDVWPPPSGAGNYAGSEARDVDWQGKWQTIVGYQDGYAHTSPVGRFTANRFGLYDMGGNVWQWCEDWFDNTQRSRVVRGAAWDGACDPNRYLVSSCRINCASDLRQSNIGFRCVLADASSR